MFGVEAVYSVSCILLLHVCCRERAFEQCLVGIDDKVQE